MANGFRFFGHPAHPALVHFPIAGWVGAPLCDAAALATGDAFWSRAAFWLLAAGVAGGTVAAGAGLADLPALKTERAQGAAVTHASLMSLAYFVAIASLVGRMAGDGGALWPVFAGAGAALLTLAGAWFGGDLVHRHGAGRVEES